MNMRGRSVKDTFRKMAEHVRRYTARCPKKTLSRKTALPVKVRSSIQHLRIHNNYLCFVRGLNLFVLTTGNGAEMENRPIDAAHYQWTVFHSPGNKDEAA
jgi:hypothetical protein